jgi:predicted O-methyltransferase YrrM
MTQAPEHISQYLFTTDWFEQSRPIWTALLSNFKPARILEIGSYEGASICFCIDFLSQFQKELEIICIDTWNDDFYGPMAEVYERFRTNTSLAISNSPAQVQFVIYKEPSINALAQIISENSRLPEQDQNAYDLIYVDGSHMAKDVITDAVMAFPLLKVGGLMIFDDYLWSNPNSDSSVASPKIAIDAFTTIFRDQIQFISAPLYQLYMVKTAP